MKNKTKSWNIFTPLLPSSWAQLPYWFFYHLSLDGTGGQGRGFVVSSSCIFFTTASSLWFSPALTWGPAHGRQTFTDFWQCKSISLGAVLGEQSAPMSVLQEIIDPVRKLLQCMSLVHGATGCLEPGPAQALYEMAFYFRAHLSAPVWSLPQAARVSLHWCWENLPQLLLHWPWCVQSCSSHLFLLLFWAAIVPALFPHIKCVIPEVLLWLLMDLAFVSGGSILELTGFSSVGHGGCFWHLLSDATSVVAQYKALSTHPEHLCTHTELPGSLCAGKGLF